MRIVKSTEFTGTRPWEAMLIEQFTDATVRLHWTDAPYVWHVNDGPEVFVVLNGQVDMHTRSAQGDAVHRLTPGDLFHAELGDAHMAHPVGPARVLVIETTGSI